MYVLLFGKVLNLIQADPIGSLTGTLRMYARTIFFWTFHNAPTYRLFVCQDENEDEDQSFRSFWIKPVTNEPDFQWCTKYKSMGSFVTHYFQNQLMNLSFGFRLCLRFRLAT